jgi:hypothetical protein
MTPPERWTDDAHVIDVLGVIFGAAEAVVRADPIVDIRLACLHRCGDTDQVLVAIAVATLDQLSDGIGDRIGDVRRESTGELAGALLERAVQLDLSPRSAVLAAASRLDAVRRNDRWMLAAELRRARAIDSDDGLVAGAIVLLAATVELCARRRGQAPELMAGRLCRAASSRQRKRAPSPLNVRP